MVSRSFFGKIVLLQKLHLCHLIKKNETNLGASGKKEEENQ